MAEAFETERLVDDMADVRSTFNSRATGDIRAALKRTALVLEVAPMLNRLAAAAGFEEPIEESVVETMIGKDFFRAIVLEDTLAAAATGKPLMTQEYKAAYGWLRDLFDYGPEPAEHALEALNRRGEYSSEELEAAEALARVARHETRKRAVDGIVDAGKKNGAAGALARGILDAILFEGLVRYDYVEAQRYALLAGMGRRCHAPHSPDDGPA